MFFWGFGWHPCYDVEEVCDYKYISPSDLLADIVNSPQKYTPGLNLPDKVLESKFTSQKRINFNFASWIGGDSNFHYLLG